MAEQGGGGGVGVSSSLGPRQPPTASAAWPPSTMSSSASIAAVKPVPMKLFASWEVDKSTPSCIPRLCSLTLTRLVVLKPLENDLHSLIIAIKMQSSKRVLRSNEIILQSNGLLDTELDLSFALQYPHFFKRDSNQLQVMLQRRKRYKNRTILGFRTLAAGFIDLGQVLQHPSDQELYLYADAKEQSTVVAQVMILSLCSQPVDHDDRRHAASVDVEMSDEDDIRDDQDFSSNEDMSDVDHLPGDEDRPIHARKLHSFGSTFTSRQKNLKQKFVALLRRFRENDEVLESAVQDLGEHESNPSYVEDLFDDVENLSESDPDIDTISVHSTPKPRLRPFFAGKGGSNSNLGNIKTESEENERLSDDSSVRRTTSESNPQLLWMKVPAPQGAAAHTLGTTKLSCSDPWNECSVPSADSDALARRRAAFECAVGIAGIGTSGTELAPVEVLYQSKRKRFASKKSSSFRERKPAKDGYVMNRRSSTCNTPTIPRHVLIDQMAAILSSEHSLPECLILINATEWQGQLLAQNLQNTKHRIVCTCSPADVRAVMSSIVNRIQKYCNKNSASFLRMKIAVVGSDGYVNSVLRPYVELFSSKSPDWLNCLRFLIVPFGNNTIAKNLTFLDVKYGSLFNDSIWKENICEKTDNSSTFVRFSQSIDLVEIASRILRYISGANHLVQLPLAEAIITTKDRGSVDDCSQLIVPFIGEVRLGPVEAAASSMTTSSTAPSDAEDLSTCAVSLSSSPPTSTHMISDKLRDTSAHSLAPSSAAASHIVASDCPSTTEAVDLQVDYWMISPKADVTERLDRSAKKEVKCSLKSTFCFMQIFRPQPSLMALSSSLSSQQHLSSDATHLAGLSMIVITKEKKQKIMRLGKKSKELDAAKSQQIDVISRVICTSKSQNHLLNVSIDGVDWSGVKFFQVSSQWQTHVKFFPVLVFGTSEVLT